MNNFYQGCGTVVKPGDLENLILPVNRSYICEEKYDGRWVSIHFDAYGEVQFYSRTGTEQLNLHFVRLAEKLKPLRFRNIVLTGEALFGTQTGTKYIEEYGHSKLYIFDMVFQDTFLTEKSLRYRLQRFEEALESMNVDLEPEWIEVSKRVEVRTGSNAMPIYRRIIEAGGEGIVIKDISGTTYYSGEKNKNWMKVKKHVDMDYIITGFTESKSASYRTRGLVGGVIGALYVNGVLTDKCTIGSMSEFWRSEFFIYPDYYIGQVMTCNGFEIFDSGALRHPSFQAIRKDKAPESCTWSV